LDSFEAKRTLELIPNFSKILLSCVFTVFSETNNISPISLFVKPSAASLAISASLSVK
jgi:hypothetical protein